MENDKVAIIILNWNSYKDTLECLYSLKSLTHNNFTVFLIDNDSTDGSFEKLKKTYLEDSLFNLDIEFIQSGANLGFAGGNNIGIRRAYDLGYQYFWLLNNDTIVTPNALDELVYEIKRDNNIGIVGSKILFYGTNKIWFAGGRLNQWTGNVIHVGEKEVDEGQYDDSKEVDYITGCSLLFKRAVLESIGYMKEDYFLYYEETDWNVRAKRKGWKIRLVPNSVISHKVSISSGGINNPSPYVEYYIIRNAFIMIRRTQSKLKVIVAFLYIFWKTFKKFVKMFVKRYDRKVERIWYLSRAIIDAINLNTGKHPKYK